MVRHWRKSLSDIKNYALLPPRLQRRCPRIDDHDGDLEDDLIPPDPRLLPINKKALADNGCQQGPKERATGLEPMTFSLESRRDSVLSIETKEVMPSLSAVCSSDAESVHSELLETLAETLRDSFSEADRRQLAAMRLSAFN